MMDRDKLSSFVKNLVDKNKKEELDILWSFLFSGCATGFKKFTDEAKEHFAKIFKQSLELKYNEPNPFRIIDNVTIPLETELGGLNVSDLDNERILLGQVLLSSKADKVLIDELKRRIKELKEADKEILGLILGFFKIKKFDTPEYDAVKEIKYVETRFNEICKLLHDFRGVDKTSSELTCLLVSSGFILSPYIGSSAAYSTSEKIVIPLFLLEIYTENFLSLTLINEIKNWQEETEEKIERAEKEQKIEYSSWGKQLREREETQKQLQNRLNSYISELIQNRDFISIDVISTLAFTSTAKSYVDINRNRDRAEEFREWLWKLAVENIKIKHNSKEKEAKKKVNETFDKFFDVFSDFLSYEYYDYNISALYDVLKSLSEVEKEDKIKNKLESFSEREKRAISFLIEYIKLELTEFLDREIVTLNSSDWGLGKCNQIINHIFEENYGENEPFKRRAQEIMPFMGTQVKIERYSRFEIGDIAVRSGLGFWSPRITGSSATGFGVELTFPTWLLTKSWENLPKIPSFEEKIIEVKSQERSQKFSDSIKKELKIDLDEFGPFEFENFISQLFGEMGYEVWPTRKTGDYGIDIIVKKDDMKIGVQVKKFDRGNLVGTQDVQKILGSRFKHGVDKCILITTSDFTPQAKEQARNAPIELWNRSTLEEKIKKYLLI